MSAPKVSEIIGGYIFAFEEERIDVKVTRLRTHASDSRVTGELQIINPATQKAVYPQTSLNFTSERTRTQLAKALSELKALDWGGLLNSLCLRVIDLARTGEPVLELWTSDEIKKPEWLLEPLIYKGLPTIIFGEKAVCKSTLALAIYACLALAWEDNPWGWITPSREIKTLLLDYEVDYEVAQWNAKRLQEGMGLPAFPLYYRRCALPLADDIAQLQEHMVKIGAEGIIVDSLGPAVGGDLKDAAQALRFTTALRQLKCAALIIGQTSKPSEGKKTASVYGSTFFEYYARNIIEIKKVQEEGEDDLDIALYNTYHNLGKRFKPMGYHLNFNGSGTHIEQQEITAPELVERFSTQARIKDLLLHFGKMKVKEIAENLGVSENSCRLALSRMNSKNLLVKDKEGYAIKSVEEL